MMLTHVDNLCLIEQVSYTNKRWGNLGRIRLNYTLIVVLIA